MLRRASVAERGGGQTVPAISQANDPFAVPLGTDDTEYFDRGFLEKPAGERRSFYPEKRPATLHLGSLKRTCV